MLAWSGGVGGRGLLIAVVLLGTGGSGLEFCLEAGKGKNDKGKTKKFEHFIKYLMCLQ